MVRLTPRRAASASIALICALFPSARATQVRRWCGSRRSASSNPAAMTPAMSLVTEAVSHFPVALGREGRAGFCLPGGVMTSAGVRGWG